MNKRASSPLILIAVLGFIILLLGGYISFDIFSQNKRLEDIKIEMSDLRQGEQTSVFFDVVNGGGTTFLGKIEILTNSTCFQDGSEKLLSEIAPESRLRASVNIRTKSSFRDNTSVCVGKSFEIKLVLEDASGKPLHNKIITINIVGP